MRDTSKLAEPRWVHFVAIGGTGMGALAVLLQDEGYIVTGSDGPLYPPMSDFLDSKKIKRVEAYRAENLDGAQWKISREFPDLIIIGNAISRGHPEALRAEELFASNKSERMSFAAALAHFGIRDRKSFVVAGTHGKTSTSTQMAWALESLGQSPGFFIGGVPGNFGQGCRMGQGSCFVSEGDEYDTAYWDKESKFLHYRPTWVLCTGIEFDHVDIYANLEQIEKSFHKLITKTKEGWVVVDKESAPNAGAIERLCKKLTDSGMKFFKYGEGADSEYRLLSVETCLLNPEIPSNGTLIRFSSPRWGVVEIKSALSGKHNALNTLGIIATLVEAGEISQVEEVQKYLDSFKGVKRRQEELYVDSHCIIMDDFAHHPTAIYETIRCIKQRYPEHKLAAFFEPRSASSARNVFQKEFATCFREADSVYLSPPTKTNIPENEKLDVSVLKTSIEATGPKVFINQDVKVLAEHFAENELRAKNKVVALVMSNGSFSGLHKLLIEKSKEFKRSSGQTTIEYILFLALILGVSLGVFHNIIFKKMDEIQSNIAAKTSEVLSQNTMGTPIGWFDLESDKNWDAKFDSFSNSLTNGGRGVGPGGNSGPNSGRGPGSNSGKGPNGKLGANSGSGPSGSKSGNSNASNSSNAAGSSSSSKNFKNSSGGQRAEGESIGAGKKSTDARGKVEISQSESGSQSGRKSNGGVSGGDPNAQKTAKKDKEKGSADDAKKDDKGTVSKSGSIRFDGRKVASQSRGCNDIDMVTLIKLLGSVGVILIGAIVMLSGRGGGKNAK